jgi:hypothetical protein
LILTDLAQIIYAPQKVFKKIVANPKYAAAIIVLVLFIGLQMGYQYAQLAKTSVETTSPPAGLFHDYVNATSGTWMGSEGVTFTDVRDHLNYTIYVSNYGYYPDLFGNSSLQIKAENQQSISAAIANAFNIDCSASGFQNLSMIMKLVYPSSVTPQNAQLTLYSLNDNDFYTYDLTSEVSDPSLIGQWNNITVPIGPEASAWTENGNPTWANITSLKLDLSYPDSQNITIRLSALFFRGDYMSLAENDPTVIVFSSLQSVSLQFLVMWLLTAAIIYLVLKGLKVEMVWKPIFVAVGAALIVLVIRAALGIVLVAATLPQIYYPYDLSVGLAFNPYGTVAFPMQATDTLTPEALAAFNNIEALTATFRAASLFLFGVCYAWFGILCVFIVDAIKPELTLPKKILAASVAVIITLIVLIFLLLGYA